MSAKRKGALLWQLLSLMLSLGSLLALFYWLFWRSQACGDGHCVPGAGENPQSCPEDCQPFLASGGSAVLKPDSGPIPPVPMPPTSIPPTSIPPGLIPPTPIPPTPIPPTPIPPAPIPPAPKTDSGLFAQTDAGLINQNLRVVPKSRNLCKDPTFQVAVLDIIKQCQGENICKTIDNPAAGLTKLQFMQIFGQSDDKDVRSMFAVFGCNLYSNTKPKKCRDPYGFFANPKGKIPKISNYWIPNRPIKPEMIRKCNLSPNCVKYAKPLYDELFKFVEENYKAKYFIILGKASHIGDFSLDKSGRNIKIRDAYQTKVYRMSKGNQRLASNRANSVNEVIEEALQNKIDENKLDINKRGTIITAIVDNAKVDYYQEEDFKIKVKAQIDKLNSTIDRGFEVITETGINRSAMILAIHCDLPVSKTN